MPRVRVRLAHERPGAASDSLGHHGIRLQDGPRPQSVQDARFAAEVVKGREQYEDGRAIQVLHLLQASDGQAASVQQEQDSAAA
jgi:hypothetical protein